MGNLRPVRISLKIFHEMESGNNPLKDSDQYCIFYLKSCFAQAGTYESKAYLIEGEKSPIKTYFIRQSCLKDMPPLCKICLSNIMSINLTKISPFVPRCAPSTQTCKVHCQTHLTSIGGFISALLLQSVEKLWDLMTELKNIEQSGRNY